MRRVAVVGVPGAGKSTLARAVGARCSLPVIHLDAYYFNPGWRPKSDDEWQPIYDELVAREAWVMDGAFAMDKALQRADTVVVLDLPRWRGLVGAITRNLRQRRNPPPDFASGCREGFDKQFFHLLRLIWRYDTDARADLEAALSQLRADQAVVRLRTRRAAEEFIHALPPDR
jgi:adenylate kinase family enzyme